MNTSGAAASSVCWLRSASARLPRAGTSAAGPGADTPLPPDGRLTKRNIDPYSCGTGFRFDYSRHGASITAYGRDTRIMSEPTNEAGTVSTPAPVVSVSPVVLPAPGRAVDPA